MELARENPRWRGRQQWREGQRCRRTRGGGGLGKRYLVGAWGNGRWRDVSPAARSKAAAAAGEWGFGGLRGVGSAVEGRRVAHGWVAAGE